MTSEEENSYLASCYNGNDCVTNIGKSPAMKRIKMDVIIGGDDIPSSSFHRLDGQKDQQVNLIPVTPDFILTSDESGLSPRKRKKIVVENEQSVVVPKIVSSSAVDKSSARRKLQFAKRKITDDSTDQLSAHSFDVLPQKLKFETDQSAKSSGDVKNDTKRKITKKKLGQVRNLNELREQLSKFSDVATRLNQCQEENANLELEQLKTQLSPHKSPAKTPQKKPTPQKQESPRPPAHERYRTLVEKIGVDLELPVHYCLLFEFFKATETVVSMMHRRDELITFDKLKPPVERIVRRNYDKKRLGQIKTVYPEAYDFHLEKAVSRFSVETKPAGQHHFIVTPNLEKDLVNFDVPPTITKTPTKANESLRFSPIKLPCSSYKSRLFGPSPKKTPKKETTPPPGELDERKKLTGNRQVQRRTIFRNRLVEKLKKQHREFLYQLTPSIELSDEDDAILQRWHPKFLLSAIPEIPKAILPQLPTTPKVCSAREFFNNNEIILPPQVKNILKTVDTGLAESQSSTKINALKGVPQSLLDKIRAKQAAKEQMKMLRNPEDELRKNRISRLPDLIRIIRTHYLCEKKSSLPQTNLVRVLSDSYGPSMSKNEIEKHVDLLIELAPNWISRSMIKGLGSFVKVQKAFSMPEIENMIKTNS